MPCILVAGRDVAWMPAAGALQPVEEPKRHELGCEVAHRAARPSRTPSPGQSPPAPAWGCTAAPRLRAQRVELPRRDKSLAPTSARPSAPAAAARASACRRTHWTGCRHPPARWACTSPPQSRSHSCSAESPSSLCGQSRGRCCTCSPRSPGTPWRGGDRSGANEVALVEAV